MKIQCEYCDSMIDDSLNECPYCGAMVTHGAATSVKPVTIEELISWYASKSLPPYEVTRFFLGQDIKEARAFGIYRTDDGNVVVYKNKDDGSRAIRYSGTDEAFAVNEILMKLKEEIIRQKYGKTRGNRANSGATGASYSNPQEDSYANVVRSKPVNNTNNGKSRKSPLGLILLLVGIAIVFFICCGSFGSCVGGKLISQPININSGSGNNGSSGSSTYYPTGSSGYDYDYDDYDDYSSGSSGSYYDDDDDDDWSSDFYTTSEWNNSTQYDDFDDDNDSWFDNDDSWFDDDDSWDWGSDDSWDWGSDDSWDFGSDWGSDW